MKKIERKMIIKVAKYYGVNIESKTPNGKWRKGFVKNFRYYRFVKYADTNASRSFIMPIL
jgi:hypothetical protein